MSLAILAMVAAIALYVFVLVLMTDYKSTLDIVVLVVSGLVFHAASIYCLILLFPLKEIQ